MKKVITLLTILILPALIYLYFAMGIPKVIKAPIYGPREVIEVIDSATGEKRIDTSYYTIPAFRCMTSGGLAFDSKPTLSGRLYVAIFLPPDSMKSMLPLLAEDIKLKKNTYGYGRYVFFMTTDTTGNVPVNAPDLAKELGLGVDMAFTVFMKPEVFDSVRMNHYFIHDPARPKDPWQSTTDAVLIDRLGRIRGYYNIHSAADIKKMKEDINHVFLRDEGVQTLEESKVEQKR